MNLKKCLIGAFAATLSFSSLASSSQLDLGNGKDPYYQIKSVKVVEIPTSTKMNFGSFNQNQAAFSGGEIGEVIAVADQIIAFGEKIYTIVKKGEPVVNMSWSPVSVLPKVSGKDVHPMDMENWSAPRSRKYRITYTNLYGMNVVDFTYSVNFTYGGQYNGKGRYITGAEIVPENVSVAWGYTFDASMKVVSIVNRGTKTFPVAGATLQLSYNVSTVLKKDKNNVSYFIQADGQMAQL